MPEVRLLPKAYEDLENIWRYTIEQWGTEQAITYVDELNAAFKRLADNPLLNRERSEFSPPVRIVPYGSHLIVYLAEERGITIIRVLHESMDAGTQISD